MRSHAKASSAGSSMRQASRLGSIVRRALATLAPSRGADGSGASSCRHRTSLAAAAALALLALAPGAGAKVPINGFGTQPVRGAKNFLGGQFSFAQGVAVNESGVGAPAGTAYVIDDTFVPATALRIQRFSPSGIWQFAWGQDVIAPSIDEEQVLTVDATGGVYTLTFKGETTTPLPFDASPFEVATALKQLSTVGSNLGSVPDNPDPLTEFAFIFQGTLAGTNVPAMTLDTSALEGAASVSTTVEGHAVAEDTGAGPEICTVAIDCQAASAGGTAIGGQLSSDDPGIAIDQATGHVYVSENRNRRISEFTAAGGFVRAWGWDVIASGQPADTGTGYEICEASAECKAGASGANGGEFSEFGLKHIVVDSSGHVWAADSGNNRIQEFGSNGSFIAAYGYDVDALGGSGELEKCTSLVAGACQAGTVGDGPGQFGQPPLSSGRTLAEIALDAAGNVYALDANPSLPAHNRVIEFDPTLTSATDFGASTFSAYATVLGGSIVPTQGGARLAFTVANDVTASPPEWQILELDSSDAGVEDTSLVGAGIRTGFGGTITDLAANDANESLYVSGNGLGRTRVLVLGPTPASPLANTATTAAVTDSTATLTGTVDPKGAWVKCSFQYATNPEFTAPIEVEAPDCGSLDINGGAEQISRDVHGLDPNTTYFVRLKVSRPLSPSLSVTSAPRTFTTVAPPPAITDVDAIQVSDTSARVVVTIDPRNTQTGYVIEYGTTPSLGSATAPLNIGSGTAPLTLSQVLSGLAPSTTYYYRVVATNLVGTTTSASHTLHTRATPLPLPGGRAYEQVTPPDKNYGDANTGVFSYYKAGVSVDGDGVGFCTTALFGDPPGQMTGFCAPYVIRRTAGGWQKTVQPDYCQLDPLSGKEGSQSLIPSADFSAILLVQAEYAEGCPFPLLDPAAPLNQAKPSFNLYLQRGGPPTYSLLNPLVAGKNFASQAYPDFGGSKDFSHVVYPSLANQTAEPDSPPEGSEPFRKLYEWVQQGERGCAQQGGCLSLLSRDVNDEPFTTASDLATFPWRDKLQHRTPGSAVSRDGERVFFSNPVQVPIGGGAATCENPGCDLYMREGGSETLPVSASECTTACGTPQASGDQFLQATPSGEEAFFRSFAKLTDESAGESRMKLYRWDRNAPPGHRLVDLTVDREPADQSGNLLGLLGASADGDVAYFAAESQLVAGASTSFGEKLYRWQWNGGEPSVEYLGPYQHLEERGQGDANWDGLHRQVTPSGGDLMIFSKLRYTPAIDRDADADVYRWDEEEGWSCVSCQAPGAPSGGDVELADIELGELGGFNEEISGMEPINYLSNDGSRIFFGTPDALVPQDVNGAVECPLIHDEYPFKKYPCTDVYEWHEGTVSLLSSGTGAEPSRLIGADLSGDNVFFYSRDRLIGWDRDNNVDIYDARIGGGFPEPPAQPAECEGEGCRGPGGSAPAPAAGAGSAVFEGPGNPPARPAGCKRGLIKRHGRCVSKKRSHKRRRADRNGRAGR